LFKFVFMDTSPKYQNKIVPKMKQLQLFIKFNNNSCMVL